MFLVNSDQGVFVETWKTLLHPAPVLVKGKLADVLAASEAGRLTLVIIDGSKLHKQSLKTDGELARLAKRTRLLLADTNLDSETELAALALGIVGCCHKQLPREELRKIVDVVLKGGIWVSRAALPDMLNHLRHATTPAAARPTTPKLDSLTPREREIAACVAEGASNKTIAKRLNVSDVTVKAHLTTIFHKLGISGRVQLALMLSDLKQSVAETSQRMV
ncbi:MAG: response regulator transcription factor [Rhodocyclales bacterium]|nr:response regulator transcription factor [Rhodocyclales bacterium]